MNLNVKSLGFALVLASFLLQPAVAVTSRVGSAQDMGIGIAVGQPTGATMKYWLSSTTAIDAVAGYHFNRNFDVHADYLWHSFSSFDVGSGRLPFYVGLGARINLGDTSHLGMRMPLGLSYLFPTDPVELFAEVAPVVRLVTKVGLDVDGLVGFRVYVNYLR
jgi:hypothetical protein